VSILGHAHRTRVRPNGVAGLLVRVGERVGERDVVAGRPGRRLHGWEAPRLHVIRR